MRFLSYLDLPYGASTEDLDDTDLHDGDDVADLRAMLLDDRVPVSQVAAAVRTRARQRRPAARPANLILPSRRS